MDYKLTGSQEELLEEAERMIRKEKAADFLNSPRSFFRRMHSGYYDERLVYNLRWLSAQDEQ